MHWNEIYFFNLQIEDFNTGILNSTDNRLQCFPYKMLGIFYIEDSIFKNLESRYTCKIAGVSETERRCESSGIGWKWAQSKLWCFTHFLSFVYFVYR